MHAGLNIVPATIPIGTLFYHGTWKEEAPSGPEWVATDPEHAYLFCREMQDDQGCWMLTFAVTRPLKVLYFDGSSAAKMPGAMDSQDLIVWGEVKDEFLRLFDEKSRIEGLCEWGRKYGLDGFLRMEPDFEVMVCDFTDALQVASASNLIPGWRFPKTKDPKPPPRPRFDYNSFRVIEAGHWHNHFPGETRVQLDVSRLISFYDRDLFPSLATRLDSAPANRWGHRVGNLTEAELKTLFSRLDEVLAGEPRGSGVDWTSNYRVVLHRYADRLEVVTYLVNDTVYETTMSFRERRTKVLEDTHEYIESMLAPYILNGVGPGRDARQRISPHEHKSRSWALPVWKKCATTHTKGISPSSLNRSERLLHRTVNEVLYEICRVIVGIWAEGVEDLGLGKTVGGLEGPTLDEYDTQELETIRSKWRRQVVTLVNWLDWSVWVKCHPACSFEETCYLRTWPWLPRLNFPAPPPKNDSDHEHHDLRSAVWGELREEWRAYADGEAPDDEDERVLPKCIRRIEPLEAP
ncbi:hypothetical protein CC1G_14465 [Coprinopsis cinerea okayama7|uniref:Uncharacterized protein n=1 Tax=Coprinopsis cinerea (strain Okayama-7 / 130 / ATCC MYA-4618 / FGSC 9003) TaxID=240176 RepID=D6RM44_COPC7|nr:hypothetical protein CC1G_14465 [Coprinopsis cinerea okayama7\|eukprot:XP_002911467.1 hypothetical protein CC1G_14465 [Coprinopsis cinerea okayama7\